MAVFFRKGFSPVQPAVFGPLSRPAKVRAQVAADQAATRPVDPPTERDYQEARAYDLKDDEYPDRIGD